MDECMKKRNIGISRILVKLMGTTLATFLFFSLNVHAEEVEELVNSEDIATASEEISTLDNKVDDLSEKCSDSGVTEEISSIADGIDNLDDLFSVIANDFTKLRSKVNQHKKDIINGLNSKVYVQDNISESASYEDIIARINDIDYKGTINVTLDSNESYKLESGYYEGGTIDVSALVEAARQEGYNAGKEEGLKEGKEEGFNAGKEEGFKEGKEEGIKEGKDIAIIENKQTWINEGKRLGDADGYARGIKEVNSVAPYYTTSTDSTYVIPKDGIYHLYASAGSTLQDNHYTTVYARVSCGGSIKINATQGWDHGKALYAAGSWSGYLSKGTVVSMSAWTDGWGSNMAGQMFSVVYGGQ